MNIQDEVMALLRELLPSGEPMPKGATDEEIAEFSFNTGIEVPTELRDWLRLCNGSTVAGGLYGVGKSGPNMESSYKWHPEMREKGWIPIADDGCGDWYVLDTTTIAGSTHPVYFIDHETYEGDADYVVASGLWKFLKFLLEDELINDVEYAANPSWLKPAGSSLADSLQQLEEMRAISSSYWPFEKKKVLRQDPDLALYRGRVPLAWEADDEE